MSPLLAKIMTFSAVGSVFALLAMSAGHTALGAESNGRNVGTQYQGSLTYSASKKHGYPNAAPLVHSRSSHADPTYGPATSQLLQARQQHRCVIDEGYGRWTACSNM